MPIIDRPEVLVTPELDKSAAAKVSAQLDAALKRSQTPVIKPKLGINNAELNRVKSNLVSSFSKAGKDAGELFGKSLNSKLRALDVQEIDLKADPKEVFRQVKEIEAKLKELSAKSATIEIKADTQKALREVQLFKARAGLGDIRMKVDVDRSSLDKVSRALKKVSDSSGGAGVRGFTGPLVAAGVAAATAAPLLVSVASSLGLASAAALAGIPAMVGLGGAVGAMKLAFQNSLDAIKKNEAMQKVAGASANTRAQRQAAVDKATIALEQAKGSAVRGSANIQTTATDRIKKAQLTLSAAQSRVATTDAQRASKVTAISKATISLEAAKAAAHYRTGNAQASSSARIEAANITLQRAKANLEAGTAAEQKFKEAMGKLSPAGQTFVNTVLKMQGSVQEFQKKLETATLPGFTQGLKDIALLSPQVSAFLLKMGSIAGGLARQLGEITKTSLFRSSFNVMLDGSTVAFQHLANSAKLFLLPLTQIGGNATPMLVRFSRAVETAALKFNLFIQAKERSGELAKFLKQAGDEAATWGHTVFNFLVGFVNLLKAANPTGKELSRNILSVSESFRHWTQVDTTKIQRFLQGIKDLPWGLIVTKIAAFSVILVGLKIPAAFVSFAAEMRELGLIFGKTAGQMVKFGGVLLLLVGGFITAYHRNADFRHSINELFLAVTKFSTGPLTTLTNTLINAVIPAFTVLAPLIGVAAKAIGGLSHLTPLIVGLGIAFIALKARMFLGNILQNNIARMELYGGATKGAIKQNGLLGASLQGIRGAAGSARIGLSNLTSFFGGPWGIAIAGATAALSLWMAKVQANKTKYEEFHRSLKDSISTFNELKAQGGTALGDLVSNNPKFQELVILMNKAGLNSTQFFDAIRSGSRPAIDALIQAAVSQKGLTTEQQIARAQLLSYIPVAHQMTDEFARQKTTQDIVSQSTNTYGERAAQAAAKQKLATDALREYLGVSNQVDGQFQSLEEANVRLAGTLDSVRSTLSKGTTTLKLDTQAGRDHKQAILDLIQGYKDQEAATYASTAKVIGEGAAAKEAVRLNKEHVDSLTKMITPFFKSREEAKKYAEKLLAIPKKIKSDVVANTAPAEKSIQNFIKGLGGAGASSSTSGAGHAIDVGGTQFNNITLPPIDVSVSTADAQRELSHFVSNVVPSFNFPAKESGLQLGYNISGGTAEGIKGRSPAASAAAEAMAKDAEREVRRALGIKSPSTVFIEIGKQIVEGLKIGIQQQSGGIGQIAKKMVDDMVNSIKTALGISSPSKVMAEIGKNTALGFYMGLKKESTIGTDLVDEVFDISGALKTAESIAKDRIGVFGKTVANQFSDLRNTFKSQLSGIWSSVEDNTPVVAKLQQQINDVAMLFNRYQKLTKEGATAQANEVKQALSASVATVRQNFINVRAAYNNNVPPILHDLVIFEDQGQKARDNFLRIGKNIIGGLGTGIQLAAPSVFQQIQALGDAMPRMLEKALQISSPSKVMAVIGRQTGQGLAKGLSGSKDKVLSVTGDLIDAVKADFAKVTKISYLSSKDHKRHTKVITGLFKGGYTQSGLVKFLDREQKQLLTLADKRDKIADKLSAAQDKLKSLQDEKASTAEGIKNSVTGDILGGMGAYAGEPGAIKATFQNKLTQLRGFSANLAKLKKLGLRSDLLKQLADAGIGEGSQAAQAIAQSGAGFIKQLNELQGKVMFYGKSIGNTVASSLYDAGINAQKGLVRGLQNQMASLASKMVNVAHTIEWTLKNALGIRSPSTLMASIGTFLIQGLIQGIQRMLGALFSQVTSIVNNVKGRVTAGFKGVRDYIVNTAVPQMIKSTADLDRAFTAIHFPSMQRRLGAFQATVGQTRAKTVQEWKATSAATFNLRVAYGKQLDIMMKKSVSITKVMVNVFHSMRNEIGSLLGSLAGIAKNTMNALIAVLNGGIHALNVALPGKNMPWITPIAGGVGGGRKGGSGKFARGGMVLGPGTETSDSIDARLSKNEYVLRAKSAKQVGYQRLDYINKYGELPGPGFAKGGRVGKYWPGMGRNVGNVPQIVKVYHKYGGRGNMTSGYRPGDPLWHGSGLAADFGGYNQDSVATNLLGIKGALLELIHRSSRRDYLVTRGAARSDLSNSLGEAHRNHVHLAMTPEDARSVLSGQIPRTPFGVAPYGGDSFDPVMAGAVDSYNKATKSYGSKLPKPEWLNVVDNPVRNIFEGADKKLIAPFEDLIGSGGVGGKGDASVMGKAFTTAQKMGANAKVMLALFEAGFVESGFRNLAGGDRDSVGFLQQRPSMGWPNPRDIPTATRSFVARAKAKAGRFKNAGALAQAVQVSAFPSRYNQRRGDAVRAIRKFSPGFDPNGYDGGGWLKPGLTYNGYKTPEMVLNPSQAGALENRINNIGGGTIQLFFRDEVVTEIVDGQIMKNNTALIQTARRRIG